MRALDFEAYKKGALRVLTTADCQADRLAFPMRTRAQGSGIQPGEERGFRGSSESLRECRRVAEYPAA